MDFPEGLIIREGSKYADSSLYMGLIKHQRKWNSKFHEALIMVVTTNLSMIFLVYKNKEG